MSRFFLEFPCDAVGNDEGRGLEQWLDKVAPGPQTIPGEDILGAVRQVAEDLCEAGFRGHLVMHPVDFSDLVNHSMKFTRPDGYTSERWGEGRSVMPPERDRVFLNAGRHEYQIRCDPRVERGTLTAVPDHDRRVP